MYIYIYIYAALFVHFLLRPFLIIKDHFLFSLLVEDSWNTNQTGLMVRESNVSLLDFACLCMGRVGSFV